MSVNLSPEELDALRAGYQRFAEHDASWMDRYAPQAKLTFPTTLPAGGTYEARGRRLSS